MNYLAHAALHLNSPYVAAGTAVPDWLSAVDRRVRVTRKRAEPLRETDDWRTAAIVAGVLQHLDDDQWFHNLPTFYLVSGQLARLIKAGLGEDDGFRPSFLGHIATEMLLDRVLMVAAPRLLDTYFEVLATVDAHCIEQTVNQMAREPTDRLAMFIPKFIEVRFLADYRDLDRFLFRLNQVLQRVKLPALPPTMVAMLSDCADVVAANAWELLPPAFPRLMDDYR